MRVIYRIALMAFIGLALALDLSSRGNAQQQTENVKQQLVGTWLLVSEITIFPDGRRVEGFGGNQKGILIFDPMRHYSSQLTRNSPVTFTSTRLQGTPETNKRASPGPMTPFFTASL